MDKILLGIDTGNGECKTKKTIFKSDIRRVKNDVTFSDNIAKVNGVMFVYGEGKSSYQKDKFSDDVLYNQLLIAVGKELGARNVSETNQVDVVLCVGLPPKLFSKQSQRMKEYIMAKDTATVEVDGKEYQIKISKCFVTVQGLAATKMNLGDSVCQVMSMDIGYGTVDFLYFSSGKVVEEKCGSEIFGIRACFEEAKAAIMDHFNEQLNSEAFEAFIRDLKEGISEDYCQVLSEVVSDYTHKLYGKLLEHGYNPNTMALHVMGGGAFIFRKEQANVKASYDMDVHSNAIGYEAIAKYALGRHE